MNKDIVTVARALHFSAQRHAGQRRKGATAEPYVNHLAEVALLLAEAGLDATVVAAGLLHDTIEDTATTTAELEAAFGRDTAALVAEVTDDKGLPRERRKQLQIETAAVKSRAAKAIKIADKISNLRSLAASPPLGWDPARKRDYLRWAKAVVDQCRGVHPGLELLFDQAHEQGLASLDAGP